MDVETTGVIKQRGLTPNSNNLNMFHNLVGGCILKVENVNKSKIILLNQIIGQSAKVSNTMVYHKREH